MRRTLTTIGLLITLGLGATALGRIVMTSPAFNADLRRDNAFGNPLLFQGRDMYDRSAYLYQQAASFVRADLVAVADESGAQLVASTEVAEERARQAVALVVESLQLDPGNAGAWVVLAWARLMTGEAEQARAALNTSWQLAPYSFSLSQERLPLAFALFDPQVFTPAPELSEAERTGMIRDSETLWVQRRLLHKIYAEQAEMLGLPAHVPPTGS